MKRKLDDVELYEIKPSNQRQSVLDISVGKLQYKTAKKVEPPLLRSVLILNTLKHIEAELLKEGSQLSSNTSFSFPKVDMKSDVIDILPSDHLKMDTDILISASQSGPLPSIDTFVGTKVVPVELKAKETNDISERDNESNLATLYPASLRTDIFSEFDLPVSDSDMFSSCTLSGIKLTPLSADEVLHSFPNTGSSESFATFLGGGVSPFCKGESAMPMEDLDNIMQILVGS